MGNTAKGRRIKQEWFEFIFRKAKESGTILDKKKLLASYAIENFSTQKYGQEFLDMFEMADKIMIRGNEIHIL